MMIAFELAIGLISLVLTIYMYLKSPRVRMTVLIEDRDQSRFLRRSADSDSPAPLTRSLVVLKNDGNRVLTSNDITQDILLRVPRGRQIVQVGKAAVCTPNIDDEAFESLADIESKGKLGFAHGATLEQVGEGTVLFSFDQLARHDAFCFIVGHTAKRLSISGAIGGKTMSRMWAGSLPRRACRAAFLLTLPSLLLTCLYAAGVRAVRDFVDLEFFAYYLAYAFVSMAVVAVIIWFFPGKDDVLSRSWRRRLSPDDFPNGT